MYDAGKAMTAQEEYCTRNGLPNYAPTITGLCGRCYHNIFQPRVWPDGHITQGYTVAAASNGLITCCPHCHYSFLE